MPLNSMGGNLARLAMNSAMSKALPEFPEPCSRRWCRSWTWC